MKWIYRNIEYKWAFWVTLATSICLLVASFILPPTGIIHASVLKGVGELFGFATLGIIGDAVKRGADIRLTKGDMSVEVDNPDDEQQ